MYYEPKDLVSPQDICDLLNDLLKYNRTSIETMLLTRYNCPTDFANKNIPVIVRGDEYNTTISMIGILNGLFSKLENGSGKICYILENNKIKEFKLTEYNNI